MDEIDDFDRLGRAVARVLRDSFDTAAAARASTTNVFEAELDAVMAEVRALPAKVEADREAESQSLRAAIDKARCSIEESLASARTEADAIRAQAMADATIIVEGAGAEVARARQLVAEERVRLDTELKDLLRDVRTTMQSLEGSARADHEGLLDRATTEARMILRQARLHHRSTAKEVDRMIEAAAAEAAALRSSALADAARIAARVRSVVDLRQPTQPEQPAEPGLDEWRREAPASASGPTAAPESTSVPVATEHRKARRRSVRPLAS